jgi:hypothetical protein
MTEGLVIGSLLVLGGLVVRYMQTHPFYRYKTQKHKERYQSKLHDALEQRSDTTGAYWLSRAIADFIFDFGQRTYHDYHVEQYEKRAQSEIPHIYHLHIEEPNALCQQLVERAVEMKVPATVFGMHMRVLWRDYLVPVGRLAPKSIERVPGSAVYCAELSNLPASKEDMQRFMEKTTQAH